MSSFTLPGVGQLIGVPFEYGGRGPDTYDCWGLVMECHRRVYFEELPDLASPTDAAVQHALGVTMQMNPVWQRLSRYEPGSVIAIRLGRYVCHAAFALNYGDMLHTWESTNGVIQQPIAHWGDRIEGYYRYVG